MEITLFHQLREISDAIGTDFTLRAHQSLLSYEVSDTTVMVALTVHKYTETVRETKLTAQGTRIITFKVGSWVREERTLWDEDFTPYALHQVGRIESPTEYADRREWEGMQYRVGSSSDPMDNAHRSTLGYAPMEDYWNRK